LSTFEIGARLRILRIQFDSPREGRHCGGDLS
jgi:hypothetical protein